ncbi:MAG: ABC transporter permease [Cyclobacteriaceae bacterium]
MKQKQPPKFPLRVLKWFCNPDYHQDIEGDLLELYERRLDTIGRKKANRKLAIDVLKLFRPGILGTSKPNKPLNQMTILRHNLKFIFRSFSRNKASFLINIIGLSSGLACASLIYLWVNDEMGVDKFHENDDRLYQVMMNGVDGSTIITEPHTAVPLAKALEDEFAGVEAAVSVLPSEISSGYLGDFKISTNGSANLLSKGHFAQKDYFNLFSYRFISGNSSLVLHEPRSIAISESTANKLFGSVKEAIGQTLDWQLGEYTSDSKVTGVFEDVPKNSTSQFDFVLSYDSWMTLANLWEMQPESWSNQAPYTYVLLKPETDLAQFQEEVRTLAQTKNQGSKSELLLIPYSSQYLYGKFENGHQTGSRIVYVKIFFVIALFIILIACINFMNLSTARASKRMKEVGIKKTFGITRKDLAVQFVSESFVMTILSSLVALVIVWVSLPYFNEITGKTLSLNLDLDFMLGAAVIIVITGLFAGSYPAFYLSRFKPISVLKGKMQKSLGEVWIRRGLVVFQFVISIVLITGVWVIYTQVSFLQNKNLGYDKEHVIFFAREGAVSEKEDVFLSELTQIPGVVAASSMGGNFSGIISTTDGLGWEGKDPNLVVGFAKIPVNYNLIETLGIEMVAGRSFSRDFNETKSLILNESAINIIGYENPVGRTVKLWRGEDYKIIGVVKDFHIESLHNEVKPLFMYLDNSETFTMMARLHSENQQETIEAIDAYYQEFNPDFPLEFKFLDSNYQSIYASEKQVSTLSKIFAGLAIVISCLGLLGLVAFTAERRTKEIGIRKILGLSEFGVVWLISRDFMSLVFGAIIIALPITYLIARNWLDQFAYRIELEWWFFAGSGISALLLAWAIAGWQTFKIAKNNPVDSLQVD